MAQVTAVLTLDAFNRLDSGVYSDGGGLYVQVTEAGTKSAFLRYKAGGKWRKIGLGSCPSYARLKELRLDAREQRVQAERGVDLIEKRDREAPAAIADIAGPALSTASTFKECAENYIRRNESGWKNAKHKQQWKNTLATYVYPTIGHKSVEAITTDDVVSILSPIWLTKAETANRVRSRIELVLSAAIAQADIDIRNVAELRGRLENRLPKRGRQHRASHHEAMPYARLPAFMVRLRAMPALAARALELCILTAARSGEVLSATWDEFDLKAGAWMVPADRMKAGRRHRVPLSPRAIEVLQAAQRFKVDGNPFAFPGEAEGKSLSNMAMSMLLRRMGEKTATVHGFRSTFKDWAHETTSHPTEAIEMALAHSIGDKVEAAYRRGDLLEKRKPLMNEWATYCLSSKEQAPEVGRTVDDVLKRRVAARARKEREDRLQQMANENAAFVLDMPELVTKRGRGRPRKVRL